MQEQEERGLSRFSPLTLGYTQLYHNAFQFSIVEICNIVETTQVWTQWVPAWENIEAPRKVNQSFLKEEQDIV